MRAAGRWLRRWYGERPLHLLTLLASFALAGYAVLAVVTAGQGRGFAVWFAVAIVGHDLLLFPLYSLADLSVRRLLPSWAGGTSGAGGAGVLTAGRVLPPVVNYLRVPAAFSLLVLIVWFPLILGLSAGAYHRASGLSASPYLGRWLAFTGAMFAGSAVCYAVALRRAGRRARRARRAGEMQPPRVADGSSQCDDDFMTAIARSRRP